MKLQSKLALFNTVSKAVIVLLFVLVMPHIIHEIAILNTDQQLKEKKKKVLELINSEGISAFIEEGSESGYGSYNLLKEEFISLELFDQGQEINGIENSKRQVEGEIVNYRVLSYTFNQNGQPYLLEIGRSLSTISEIALSLRKFALYTLLAVILVTTLFDIAFTKYLLKPLNIIIDRKLKKIQDPGSFKFKRIETSTSDFKYLDESIHEMMDRIEDAFLKEREFIANVSHELLTPVSILQSKLENILSSDGLSEDNATRILESQRTLNRLKNIIKTLLLISKIENEQYLKKDSVAINELLGEVLEEIEVRLEAKEIKLIKEIEQDYLLNDCNKSLLYTMIFNIVNNAIKYNKNKGTITIKGYKRNVGYVLEVQDTGVGIKQENLPFIFNRFKHFSKSDSESFGLGLPIVKTVANFHKIAIDVASVPAIGSTFRLIFT